jgi:hypothetical protein
MAHRERIARMIRRHKWMHRRGYAFAGAIDATSGRYVPDASEILTSTPRPGAFYIPRKGIYPATVAKVAYGADLKRGLLLMNASTWNDHIRRAAAGWESYKVKGLQFDARYGSNPRSTYGSGNAYPVVWVPPLDAREPEAVIVSPTPPSPTPIPPGGGGGSAAPIPPSPTPTPTPPSGGGYVVGRYVPTSAQILTGSPRPGTFYRPRKGIYPIKVAEVAYGASDRKRGVLSMNASTWNDHIRRAAAGWESYKVKGLQFDPRYGAHPSSFYGTGNAYPVVWVPPITGEEPEAWFSKAPPGPAPGPILPPVPPPPGPIGPILPPVPPYVPPEGPVTPPTPPPYVPPEGPVTPPEGPVTPPYVPPYVPPEGPIMPPTPPIVPPPVPPYVPPPSPPIAGGVGLGGVVAGVTIISAIAKMFEG